MNFHQPVPAIPVLDVPAAQEYYRDIFGFKVEWLMPDKSLGAASHANTALFFRQTAKPVHPAELWIYCDNVDDMYAHLNASGANIVEEIEQKPWNLRQFQVEDLYGNRLYFHGG